MKKQKNALAVHDISCVGRCSLTVALPILSAAGIETSVLPTAVLSTHTGGFAGYTYRDLTEDVLPISDHWATMGLKFDAIYSGYLGSIEQIDLVLKLIKRHAAEGCIALVDPVMADNGKLYAIFPPEFPMEMRKVCSKADVLMPNITEATLLLGEEYKEGPYTPEYIEGLMERLTSLGPRKIILTGVYFDDVKLGAATYDADTGEKSYYFCDKIPGYYHGTGDVFGSAVVASLIRGRTLPEASRIAVDFTVGSIRRTYDAKTDIRFGVDFEEGIPQLIEDVLEDDEDLAQRVYSLAKRIWHEWYSDILTEEQIDYMLETYHSLQAICDELEEGYEYVVFRDSGKDIGYCGFHNEGDRIYIGKLYLLKEYRGKGYGRKMFEIIDRYARSQNVDREYLRVNKGNPTVDIYKKIGFIIKESVVADIGNGFVMDDYIMERSLR